MRDPEAIFDNIQNRIVNEIKAAKFTIHVAVPWFTSSVLFNVLLERAKRGVEIQLIILEDEINNESGIQFTKLTEAGDKNRVWRISNLKHQNSLMHSKFCIIDKEVVLMGSYNWTNKAERNQESIVIHRDDSRLAMKFFDQFNHIVGLYFGASENSSIDIRRLWLYINVLKMSILSSISLDELPLIDNLDKLKILLHESLSPGIQRLIKSYNRGYHADTLYEIGKLNILINRKALEAKDKAVKIHLEHGYDEAIKSYDEALDIKPDMEYIWELYAKVTLNEKKSPESAIPFVSILSAINPLNFDTIKLSEDLEWALTGDARMFENQDYKLLNDIFRSYPGKNTEVLCSYCQALIGLGKVAEAEKILLVSIDENKYDIKPIRVLGFYYTENDRHDEACQLLARIVNLLEDDVELLIRYGYSLLKTEKLKEGIKVLKLALELKSNDLRTLSYLGEAYANNGQKRLAIQMAKRILVLEPEDSFAKEILSF